MESFNGKLEEQLLDREQFQTLKEARVLVADYRIYYNGHQSHSPLDYMMRKESCAPLSSTTLG